MFCSTPGSEPARSDAERCQAPVVHRKEAPYKLAHGRANITIRRPKATPLGIRGHRAARVKDLRPTRARPQQTKCALGIRELADGGQEGSGFGNATTEKFFAPFIGPDRSTQEHEVGGTVPRAPVEVTRAERLGGGHAGMTSVLSGLTVSPTWRKPSVRAARKQRTAGAEPAQKPSSRKKEQRSIPPGCEVSVTARASAMAG